MYRGRMMDVRCEMVRRWSEVLFGVVLCVFDVLCACR